MQCRTAVPLLAALTAIVLSSCTEPFSPASEPDGPAFLASSRSSHDYVILSSGPSLPAGLEGAITAAGGALTGSQPAIGVAFASSDNPRFAAALERQPGVHAVVPDLILRRVTPTAVEFDTETSLDAAAVTPGDETFFAFQWNMQAINAPAAWAANHTGAGVRVAVIDGGIYHLHPDLAANLDVARSVSFVPGQPFNNDVGTFWHGTHVAGIVAAADNGFGVIGVAPEATLIGVKVLHDEAGAFSWMINGIVYAATPIAEGGAGADVINLSLGAGFPKQGAGLAHLANALERAVTYAYQRGTTVTAALGNDAVDLDHSKNLIYSPAMTAHAIAIAATGPVNFAGGGTNFRRPASYTNFGQSAVDFAAPGGDFTLVPVGNWILDMVISTCRGATTPPAFSFCFGAGTSAAAPHAAGIAALIIQANGGPMHPAHVEAKLRQIADDEGKRGRDDFYGLGFLNAGNLGH